MLARLDFSLDEAHLAVMVAELLPNQRHRPIVAEQLKERPDLLTGAGAQGSATIVRLIEELRDAAWPEWSLQPARSAIGWCVLPGAATGCAAA